MNETNKNLVETVTRRTAADVAAVLNRTSLEDHLGLENWVVKGPVRTTATSQIFRATSDRRLGALAVKVAGTDSVNEQFQALDIASRALAATPGLTSPRPIAVFKSEGILLMEWVEGRNLDHFTNRIFAGRQKLQDLGQGIGQMLRAIHKFEPSGSAPLPVDRICSEHRDNVSILDQTRRTRLEPAATTLEALAESVGAIDIAQARIHGDFKPSNIIIENNRLVCIDAQFRYVGPIIYDLAQFINHCALSLYIPRYPRGHRPSEVVRNALLMAYDQEMSPSTVFALDWLCLSKHLFMYVDEDIANQSSIRGSFMRNYLLREIQQTISRLRQ